MARHAAWRAPLLWLTLMAAAHALDPAPALPANTAAPVLLESVDVRAKAARPEPDESFKRARDAVAKFGQKPISDTPVRDFLVDRFAPPPPRNSEPNDIAAPASQHGLAVAGCAGCSIPENRR